MLESIKKIILLVGVIGIFGLYTVLLRHQHGSTNGPTSTPALASSGVSNTTGTSSDTSKTTLTSIYKDGTYTGASENAFYGNVQIQATISGGKLTSVEFLSYANDSPNSQSINDQAMPILKQEALKAQSANVDIVSGATLTSQAFAQSLQSALQQAKA